MINTAFLVLGVFVTICIIGFLVYKKFSKSPQTPTDPKEVNFNMTMGKYRVVDPSNLSGNELILYNGFRDFSSTMPTSTTDIFWVLRYNDLLSEDTNINDVIRPSKNNGDDMYLSLATIVPCEIVNKVFLEVMELSLSRVYKKPLKNGLDFAMYVGLFSELIVDGPGPDMCIPSTVSS